MNINDMAEMSKAKLIARKLAKWHRIEVPGEPSPGLFRIFRKWHSGLPSFYQDPAIQSKWTSSGLTHEWLLKEFTLLESKLTSCLDSPVVFCHNDLLSANIIYQQSPDDVSFIDYEYGAMNYRGFDIGNHFCEYAGFECLYEDHYPDKSAQIPWLRAYLAEFQGCSEELISELELEQLYLEVNLFGLTSHFFWGLWALIQADLSDIQFDYMGYAIKRFKRYQETKDIWLSRLDSNA